MKLTLPTDSTVRKDIPLYSGCYTYFPAALAGVAMQSKAGNDKHNPGEPLHHVRGKSMDHADCIARHSMDLADMLAAFERDGTLEVPAVQQAILSEARALSWRSLAWHQELEERFGGAPLAPAARLPKMTLQEAVQSHLGNCGVDPPYLGEPQEFIPVEKSPVAAPTDSQLLGSIIRQCAHVDDGHPTSTRESARAYEGDPRSGPGA